MIQLFRFLSIIVFCLILLSACQGNDGQAKQEGQQNLVRVKQPIEQNESLSGSEAAKHIVEIATSVPNVNDATAIVIGDFAIVGIDVKAELDRSRVGSIKYSVAESLKHDKYGANSIVVADPDTFTRLENISNDIQNGQPVSGFIEELSGIVGRVIPQVPNEIMESPKPTDQNKSQLSEQEKKMLEKEQFDQSNKTGS